MMLLEYLLVLISVLCCTAAPAADIPQDHCKAPPYFDDKVLQGDWIAEHYVPGTLASYTCRPGFIPSGSIRYICIEGIWEALASNRQCTNIKCNKPQISHGQVTSAGERFNKNEFIDYTCDLGYRPNRTPRSVCTETGWSPPPVCEEITCRKENVRYGRILESKDYYSFGETVTLECNDGYVIVDKPEDPKRTCTSHGWSPSLQCISKKCDRPDIPNGSFNTYETFPKEVDRYVKYSCNRGYAAKNRKSEEWVQCTQNGWNPEPRCLRIGGKCGAPPTVQYGDTTGRRQLIYDSGSTVQYQCANFYKLDGKPEIKCEDGEWEKAPICRVPCTVTKTDMEKNKIYLRFRNEDKIYTVHDDTIEFSCKTGYEKPKTNPMRVQCVNGAISLPKCLLPGSCVLQESEMSQRNIIYSQSLEIRNGETIVFECTEGTKAEGKLDAKCNGGKLDYPRCEYAPPCTLQVEELESHNIYYDGSTNQIQSGQTITFTCAEGTIEEEEESLVATCKNGNIKYPKCAIPNPCYLSESILEENHIELDLKEEKKQSNIYQHDEAINVKCRKNFKHPGILRTVCFNGTWRSRKCFEKNKSLCRINQQSLDDNLLVLDEQYNDDSYYGVGDIVWFKCKTGHSAPSKPIGTCSKPRKPANAEAVLKYPKCT